MVTIPITCILKFKDGRDSMHNDYFCLMPYFIYVDACCLKYIIMLTMASFPGETIERFKESTRKLPDSYILAILHEYI